MPRQRPFLADAENNGRNRYFPIKYKLSHTPVRGVRAIDTNDHNTLAKGRVPAPALIITAVRIIQLCRATHAQEVQQLAGLGTHELGVLYGLNVGQWRQRLGGQVGPLHQDNVGILEGETWEIERQERG